MCNAPIHLTTAGAAVRASCGHCLSCARRRTMSWTVRLLLEMTEHTSTDFLTLTYRPDIRPDHLDYDHLRLFIKRLKRATQKPVRYFSCGEFGTKTGHPHWHVLLYGHQFPERGLFHTELWPHGHAFSGDISRASAQYVCRYTLKSAQRDHNKSETYMSRRPGIGMTALRNIATTTARKVPYMAYYPPVLTYQGKSYWLDRHAYAASVDAYMNAGGVLDDDAAPNNLWHDTIRSQPVDAIVRKWAKEAV